MALPPALRPAAAPGDDQPDTHLGRPGDGSRILVGPRSAVPTAEASLLLVGAARAPDNVRVHIARTLAMEDVEACFEEVGADLRVALVGPGDAVEVAVETIPRLLLALRRRR